jgi:hypothetical protein
MKTPHIEPIVLMAQKKRTMISLQKLRFEAGHWERAPPNPVSPTPEQLADLTM